MTIHFALLISRQGKTRLAKWYTNYDQKECARIIKEISHMVIGRPSKLCNFLEWRDHRIVYKRYASLYFIMCIDKTDNELIAMEIVHHYVETLDRYFGNVCELDLIFNFHKAYWILDEVLLNGELQETSKKAILRVVAAQDTLMDNTQQSNFSI
jgi:AP-1 complex subunit sigma 1/2